MTQRSFLSFILVGLPVGLAVSIGIALYLYYHPLDFPGSKRGAGGSFASAQRKSPTEKDLREYRRILGSDLAERSGANPAARLAAANWIASTLGPTNLGLSTHILESASGPEVARTVWAEIEGSRHKNDAIIIGTGYDTSTPGLDSGASTALVMTLANAFAGTPQRKTLVFAFTGEETGREGMEPPLRRLVQHLRFKGRTVKGIIDVRVLDAAARDALSPSAPAQATLFFAQENDPWASEIREAMAPRKPAHLSLSHEARASAPAPFAALGSWDPAPSAAPVSLLGIIPPTAADNAAALAVATSLEGVLQALANQ